MLYLIKPIGENPLFEKGWAEVYKRNPDTGRSEKVTNLTGPIFPGMTVDLRPEWIESTKEYAVNLSDKDLNEIVSDMSLSDTKTGERIIRADKKNENDPFFSHPELRIRIPSDGIRLDDKTPEGKFYFAVAQAAPKIFDINNQTENQLTAKGQELRITTAEKDYEEASKETREGYRASMILHSLKDKELRDTARSFEIALGEDPDMIRVKEALYSKITHEKDFKSKNGMRNIEYFLAITDMSADDRGLRAKLQEAVERNVLKKVGRNILFGHMNLGTNIDESAVFLQKKENTEIKAEILGYLTEVKVNVPTKATKTTKEVVENDEENDIF